jgi:hypothetical protein
MFITFFQFFSYDLISILIIFLLLNLLLPHCLQQNIALFFMICIHCCYNMHKLYKGSRKEDPTYVQWP